MEYVYNTGYHQMSTDPLTNYVNRKGSSRQQQRYLLQRALRGAAIQRRIPRRRTLPAACVCQISPLSQEIVSPR